MQRLTYFQRPTTTAPSFNLVENERRRIKDYNNTTGNLTGYDCPKCNNRGNFAGQSDSGFMSISPCECKNIRNILQKAANSGLCVSAGGYTFDKFIVSSDCQRALKEGVMNYAENGKGWLLICGPSGIGKTHLCTAVCVKWLKQGKNVRYMSWLEEVGHLKALSLEDAPRQKLLDELKKVQVLYIDDLFKTGAGPDGVARPTGADIRLGFEILNYRYQQNLTTIVSTELSIDQLLAIDESVASRMLERCNTHAYSIKPGHIPNYRLRNIQKQ